jgi:2-oxoglutarate ferredoxin oxidoreductase subunit delta
VSRGRGTRSGDRDQTPGSPVSSRGTLVIDVEACKGCELCIEACPPHVLRMTDESVNRRGYRYPELAPGCIACKLCSLICPDFVFQVYRYEAPVVVAPGDVTAG